MLRDLLGSIIKEATGERDSNLTVPEHAVFGHYTTSMALRLGKERGVSPRVLAEELRAHILKKNGDLFQKIDIAGPGFLNFFIAPAVIQKALVRAAKQGKRYGREKKKKETVIVEYASLNVAKPMHVGHLRNIAIGRALARTHEAMGYKVVHWNYLGDWGTQFGKMIVAYTKWGEKKKVQKDPITELTALYIRFHKEAKEDPALEDAARRAFRALEEGDKKTRALWRWFKELSLKAFAKNLKTLGVSFDSEIGESFFADEAGPITEELLQKGIATESEGAVIVSYPDLPPGMVRKSDGGSTYFTRDLANIRYREKKYHPAKIIYVVGNEQSLHLSQVFAAAKQMGLGAKTELTHAKYGLVLGETGKKFSTREGEATLADAVLREAIAKAEAIVKKKRPEFTKKEKETIGKEVGIGALLYGMLREARTSDIVFDWNALLDFTGESGPYLQYTRARLLSILRKTKKPTPASLKYIEGEPAYTLARAILEYPEILRGIEETLAPNMMARYLISLAASANHFYETTPILKEEDKKKKEASLALIALTADTLAQGMGILGIPTPARI
jgi:arginyl-tRNA synthetase